MKRSILLMIVGCLAWTHAQDVHAQEVAVEKKPPLIQMAILLDTSGSMSGLIEQAKTQLWTIVNEFATARRQGNVPILQVALYEYGKSSIPSEQNYLWMILPLTTDLDNVSKELFALQTNGGEEYCGAVIDAAVKHLQWSQGVADFKVVFIAGNEPFTQGSIDYKEACKAAISEGIVVNTIHCGDSQSGVNGKWKDGALLADGKYMHIDHDRTAVYIEAPQDTEIARLGEQLNSTYLAYGMLGQASAENQVEQDENAAAASPKSSVQRAVTKSSGQYRNSSWDLVDAVRENKVKLEEVEAKDLPNEMQDMDMQQKNEYLAAKQSERADIQGKIQKLNEARRKYVATEMKERADKGQDTLEAVMIQTIRQQATKLNFVFSDPQSTGPEAPEN